MSGQWYPSRRRYYRDVAPDDEIEQGDIFWGVPTLVARHPDVADSFRPPFRALPEAETLEPPALSRAVTGVSVRDDPVIVMPHTCDFYGPEKGRRNRARLVARIQKLADGGIAEPKLLRSGEGYNHAYFLPSWRDPHRDVDDMYVNLRFMTSVDAAYLSRRRRVARLGPAAVIALRRRVTYFFTDYAPPPAELSAADLAGGLIRQDRDLRAIGLPRAGPGSVQVGDRPPSGGAATAEASGHD
ncbi:MAG: hypothetical protein H0V51_17700 [Chloroflexi bacterium]|nr:hypothetical protein [Chloroflexota bacterium]